MGMNDEETVALVAGGHTFGKCHGAGPCLPSRSRTRGCSNRGAGTWLEEHFNSGKGPDTITSGIEAWNPTPTKWDMGYLKTLFKYGWDLVKSCRCLAVDSDRPRCG